MDNLPNGADVTARDNLEHLRLIQFLCDDALRPTLRRVPNDNTVSLSSPQTFADWAGGDAPTQGLIEAMWRARLARLGTLRAWRDIPFLFWLPDAGKPTRAGALLQLVHTSDGRVLVHFSAWAPRTTPALREAVDEVCARVLFPHISDWARINASDVAQIQTTPPTPDECTRLLVHAEMGRPGKSEVGGALAWWAQQVLRTALDASAVRADSPWSGRAACAHIDYLTLVVHLALDYQVYIAGEGPNAVAPREDIETTVIAGQLAFQLLLQLSISETPGPVPWLLPELTVERWGNPDFAARVRAQVVAARARGPTRVSCLIVPLHGLYHWTLLVFRLRDARFIHLDSLPGRVSLHAGLVRLALDVMTIDMDATEFARCALRALALRPDQAQEENQCGLYVMSFARAVMAGPLLEVEAAPHILKRARAETKAFYDEGLVPAWREMGPALVLDMLKHALPALTLGT